MVITGYECGYNWLEANNLAMNNLGMISPKLANWRPMTTS